MPPQGTRPLRLLAFALLASGPAATLGCGLDRGGVIDAGGGAAGAGGTTGDAGGQSGQDAAGGSGGAGGGAGSGGAGGGGVGGAGVDAGPEVPSVLGAGCADGTREGFLDTDRYPHIAACAGGWTVPGLFSYDARMPRCGRKAGNSSSNPSGSGCAIADLCAEGWHVCEGAWEVAKDSPYGCDGAIGEPGAALFFATRQRAAMDGTCTMSMGDENNVHGCGTFGHDELSSCTPLNRYLRYDDCGANPPWSCGDMSAGAREGALVTKPGSGRGGALCCLTPTGP